ncbi:MAG: hypothetical protein JSR91_07830 [Proteobacteria bacterium]|nr:hypothetical protein [Pseudomonadota bacterium]
MKIQSFGLAAALALASVSTASAQSKDVAYCQALASKYQTFLSHGSGGRHGGTNDQNANARMAADKCMKGDTSGIPVLEHALNDAKIELPTRS